MPTYDYKCDACGHAFEKFQSITAAPIRKCPVCGKNQVKRLIGIGAGVIFKGGGFYETDYRSDSYKSDAKKDSGGTDGKSDAKSDSKADTKPATPAKTDSTAAPKADTAPAKPAAGKKSSS